KGRRAAPAHRRQERTPGRNRSAFVQSIAEAVIIKDEDMFFLSQPNGQIPRKGKHGLGLYYHDCRFLKSYERRVAATEPTVLNAWSASGFKVDLQLTNPDLHLPDGHLLQKEDLGIALERVIDASRTALYDRITFRNYQLDDVRLPVSLRFAAAFEDVFTVRG